ncbi:hypothetical protein CLV58_109205 [Spirosoma oryzae]|uniref:Uncharacterized protein n=1 Tax=Spirosoma oryzae TaxID=1469603 RepID=A0A2T0SYJ0_9BACT|nr:hypothetical protein [Spirosoma oryzae]PRY38478.1 hypothetical protein CLV58_109205 [Spirosoma oryzae]
MITVNLVTDLRTRTGTPASNILTLGKTTAGDGMGGIFYWDSTDSTTSDDAMNTIQVTGQSTGRWKRVLIPGSIQKTGSVLMSGGALQTTFGITHNLGVVPSTVFLSATTAAASGARFVTNKTATQFIVNYTAAPGAGTNNVGLDWLVIA